MWTIVADLHGLSVQLRLKTPPHPRYSAPKAWNPENESKMPLIAEKSQILPVQIDEQIVRSHEKACRRTKFHNEIIVSFVLFRIEITDMIICQFQADRLGQRPLRERAE